jgi:hypothetical protein
MVDVFGLAPSRHEQATARRMLQGGGAVWAGFPGLKPDPLLSSTRFGEVAQ